MEGTSNSRTDSLIWTDAQLEFLINLLVEQSRLPGMKSGANLKPKACKAISQKMIEQFGPDTVLNIDELFTILKMLVFNLLIISLMAIQGTAWT
ncbi:hypothetical protein EJ110_NYTH03082 [Nymphaea thermarum]|nr:hypothetical protein EJ110_NYTH03082 [Nymphaea thermarum]